MILELKKIRLTTLEAGQIKAYESLALPSALFLLQRPQTEDGYSVAIEARLGNQLVGLALAEIYYLNQTAQLFSLFVEEAHRRQGIGLAIFRFLQESLVQEEAVHAIGFEYEKQAPHAEALEKILAHVGWMRPKVYLVRCHFDAYAFNPPWIRSSFRFPPDLTLFKWSELTEREREQILYRQEQGRFLPYLSPFREENIIDYPTSIGLRRNDQIIGWSITHRIDPQTIRYTALYIDSSFLLSGYGIRLLVESIRLHKQLPIPRALFEVNVEEIDPSWLFFVKKRLIPYTDKVERMKWALRIFV
ncbi:GNAT family N-acetyltransferase [Candidatus Protochlamydia phocaeensis]|uniref:GNAT family N-acetyltransferase n=1 Tax=Candidatus Protochlamydia phocaeensis TaxID=1414722 RepID=UPI0008396208|nr:GNAT family N-acetyltransferase [Candidatus Protochlamydia phocaeensis]